LGFHDGEDSSRGLLLGCDAARSSETLYPSATLYVVTVQKTSYYFCSVTLTFNVQFLNISYKNIYLEHITRLWTSGFCLLALDSNSISGALTLQLS